jgi:hypothetical protein
MPKACLLCTLVMLSTGILSAQTDSENKAARERLSYFAGTWNIEMHLKIGALNSRVYFATEHNEWTPGHSLLLSKPEGGATLPEGGLVVMGYSPSKQVYTYHVLKTSGDTEDLHGTVDDRTWTWMSDEGRTSGESAKTRITAKEISATSYTLRIETSATGAAWSTVMEGTAKKVLLHSHQDVAFMR